MNHLEFGTAGSLAASPFRSPTSNILVSTPSLASAVTIDGRGKGPIGPGMNSWSHDPKKSSFVQLWVGGNGSKLYRRPQVLVFICFYSFNRTSLKKKKKHIFRTLLTSQNFQIWVFQECFEARLTHAHGVGHKEIQGEAPISYIFRANHVSLSSNLRSAGSLVNYNELTVLPHWNDG